MNSAKEMHLKRPTDSTRHLLVEAAWFAGVVLLWWWPVISVRLHTLRLTDPSDPSVDDRSGFYFAGSLPFVAIIAVCGTVAFIRLLLAVRREPLERRASLRTIGGLLVIGLWSWLPCVLPYPLPLVQVNPLCWPTLVIWLGLYWLGRGMKRHLGLAFGSGAFLAVPGFLFAAYYTKLLGEPLWLYRFRALPFTELLAGGSGLLFGLVQGWITRREPLKRKLGIRLVPIIGLFTAQLPFLKPVVHRIPDAAFMEQWRGRVCLQSTPSTCGPASAATLFKLLGVEVSERELARECFSSRTGTENWYLARAFRRRGFEVEFVRMDDVSAEISGPAIAGVRMEGRGHFIPVLDVRSGYAELGDPMVGHERVALAELPRQREFTGFLIKIKPAIR